MPVSELDIANGLYWLFGYGPYDDRGRDLAGRLDLGRVRDGADLRTVLLGSEAFGQAYAEHYRKPNPSLALDRPRLVFLHIPKCGGTTLHAILAEHFHPGLICPERFNTLRAYPMGDLARFTLFSGHFDLESCRALPGRGTKIVTVLREPRARLISLYYFLKIHRPEAEPSSAAMVQLARSLPAESFFTHPLVRRHASVCNGLAALLIQPLACARWESIDNQLDEADLVVSDPVAASEAAFAALTALDGFGVLERFPDSLRVLGAGLGLQLEDQEPQQVTDEMRTRAHLDFAERPATTPELLAILDDLTQADRPLYDKALRLFEARLADIGPTGVTRAGAGAFTFGPPSPIHLDRLRPLEARRDGQRILASGTPGVLAVGPYMALGHGTYELTCHFSLRASAEPGFTLGVWHNHGLGKCAKVRWSGESPCRLTFTLSFDVPDLEFVVTLDEDNGFELLAIELARAVGPAMPAASKGDAAHGGEPPA